jgi:lipopolysaccharide export system permease protein
VGPFFFALFVIFFVLIMDFIIEILQMVIGKGLNAFVILEVFALNLAWMAALAVPMAVLVSTLMAFGRLSQDNEITALKASGVSLYRVVIPAVVASVLVGFGMVGFNNGVVPEANHKARLLSADIHQKRPTVNLKENVFMDEIPGYHILIGKIDQRSSDVEDITIYDHKDRRLPRTIIAEKGKIEFTPGGNTLVFRLFNGEIHDPDEKDPTKYRRVSFNKQVIYIRNVGDKLVRTTSEYRTDREKSAQAMLEDIRELEAKVRISQSQIISPVNLALSRAFKEEKSVSSSNLTPVEENEAIEYLVKTNRNLFSQLSSEGQNIRSQKRQISSLSVEVHKKYALSAACVVFVLVGAPLGIMARKGGMAVGLGLSLGFFVLYWAFLIGGEELADRQLIPAFWAMWSANILIGGAGIYVLIKSAKETTFISWKWTEKLIPRRFRND